MKYVYYCERCRTPFQVEVQVERPVPPKAVCPKCDYPHALKAYAAPSASCCGPAPAPGARRVSAG